MNPRSASRKPSRRPARPATAGRRPAPSAGRPAPGSRPVPPASRPVPVERGRAAGILGGLVAFVLGFAVAGVAAALGHGGSPVYLSGITVGLVGVGVVGFFYQRGTAELPPAKLWSPVLLRALAEPLGLPAVPVIGLLYLLGAVGIVGNVLIPVFTRR